MDENASKIFHSEVVRQCTFALLAFDDLRRNVGTIPANPADNRIHSHRTWYAVQALLVAVGNVSKLLWPIRERNAVRGQELRSSLAIDDASPLADRKFRDAFEHFDERLETWINSPDRKGFVDSNIGPPGFISGMDPSGFLRNLDTSTWALTYRGEPIRWSRSSRRSRNCAGVLSRNPSGRRWVSARINDPSVVA